MSAAIRARNPKFLKIGLRVTWRDCWNVLYTGRVDGNDVRSNGVWVAVNISPKGVNRVLKHFRPSQLTPA